MLNIKIAKEKDKAQGYWLSLPADNEQRFKVLRKLDEGEPIGKTIAICITGVILIDTRWRCVALCIVFVV
ncbi:MAG: hypothetical protein GXY50_05615 [Syntrophomonadaceae bacterium]|nr:hypothetical protein [Syntrophomonadaceae bacterium]